MNGLYFQRIREAVSISIIFILPTFFQRFSIHLISAYKYIKFNNFVRSGDCFGPSCQMVIKLGKYDIIYMLKIRLRVHLKRAIHEVQREEDKTGTIGTPSY